MNRKKNKNIGLAAVFVVAATGFGGLAAGVAPMAAHADSASVFTAWQGGYGSMGRNTNTDSTVSTRKPSFNNYSANFDSFGSTGTASSNYTTLQKALNSVSSHGGGTLVIPDRKICVKVSDKIYVPAGVRIIGAGTTSELLVSSSNASQYKQLFHFEGGNNAIENLKLTKVGHFYGRMIGIYDGAGYYFSNLTIDANASQYQTDDFSTFDVTPSGSQRVSNLTITGSSVQDTQYGFVENSSGTGTLTDVVIDSSSFSDNYADDLEFNTPNGVGTNVTVQGNSFTNNHAAAPSAGFGVGVANFQNVNIVNNSFNGYSYNPVHVEDRSANVDIKHNAFSNSSTVNTTFASDIIIQNGSHDVTVENNWFDMWQENKVYGVLMTAGGKTAATPSNVSIYNNYAFQGNGSLLYLDAGVNNLTVGKNLIY